MNRCLRPLRSFCLYSLLPLLLLDWPQPISAAIVLQTDQYQIQDSGQPRLFEVAKDELHVITRAREHVATNIPALPTAEAVREQAAAFSQTSGNEVELVLYESGVARNQFNRRILTKQVLVQLEPGHDAGALAGVVGAVTRGEVPDAPSYFIFETAVTGGSLPLAEALRSQEGVLSAEPLLARQQQKRLIPNDTLFSNQWHLRNTGQGGGTPGIDINITNVWNTYRGTGIGIAIIDDGLQHTHPDLQANYDPTTSTNINDQTADPAPNLSFDFHGTACAGVAAARGNNGLGVAGAAFEARLAGIRLIGGPTTDAEEATAMSRRNDVLYVKSMSWGPFDDGLTLQGPGPLTANALAQGVQTGRGGKGTIYVWAGGNGLENEDDANYDGYVNSIYTIAVAALGDQGNQAYYSEPGACLIVAAPSGSSPRQDITTTDLVGNDGYNFSGAAGDLPDSNYTESFSGTSSATPLVGGVVALMLEANTNLGWRDVQEILMRSATKVRPADPDWVLNGGGFNFNHKYGAGLLNAGAAIGLATNWANLGTQITIFTNQSGLSVSIPDNNPTGITRSFNLSASNLRVEHVTVTVSITHTFRGDLAITLTSPNGTQSRLAEEHSDGGNNYSNWKFMSVCNWGENSAGTWSVRIADSEAQDTGTLTSIRLDVFGTPGAPAAATADLALTMTNSPGPVVAGSPFNYALTVFNNGPTNASAVTLTDSLPASLTFGSAISSQGTCTNIGSNVVCNLGSLASNATATVTITVTPNQAGNVTNIASVAASQPDQILSNNIASAITTVSPLITNVSVVPRPTSAIVSWNTLTHATSQVEYGFTTNYEYLSPLNATLTTNHAVLLGGLVPNTNYLFRVISRAGTYEERSAQFSFSTDQNLIVDNPQARYSGNWTLGTSSPDKFGSYYQSTPTSAGFAPSSLATYAPAIKAAAKYDVFIWYPAGFNRTTNAQVSIFYDGGSLTRSVNQTANGGGWQLLATGLDFLAGTEGFATIANNTGEAGKVVMADAMRWNYPLEQDNPSDGSIPAWWANFYFGGPVSGSVDDDGDGYTTYQEYVLGSDPINAASRLEVRAERIGGGIRVTFSPWQSGRVYQLASTTNLNGGLWTLLPDVPAINGIQGTFDVPSPAAPQPQFYRLAVRLAP